VQAMIYLKLRKEGCEQKEALTFGGKSVCRADSTKKLDGPPNFRVLKAAPTQEKVTHNVVSRH
jgi:hypothetical protein